MTIAVTTPSPLEKRFSIIGMRLPKGKNPLPPGTHLSCRDWAVELR